MSRPSTASSSSSASSYDSMLSDDSYVAKLKPIDAGFLEMMDEIKIVENNRRFLQERKVQSHTQKQRDPKDNANRDWPANQEQDYKNYKAAVGSLEKANAAADASDKLAKKTKTVSARKRNIQLQKERSTYAILAATARLSFMTRYPDAFSTKDHGLHIKEVENNLNAAKVAERVIVLQLDKIAAAEEIEKRKAAAAAAAATAAAAEAKSAKR